MLRTARIMGKLVYNSQPAWRVARMEPKRNAGFWRLRPPHFTYFDSAQHRSLLAGYPLEKLPAKHAKAAQSFIDNTPQKFYIEILWLINFTDRPKKLKSLTG